MKILGNKIKDGLAIKSSVKELLIKFMKTILKKSQLLLSVLEIVVKFLEI